MSNKRSHIAKIDILRGIAIFWVFIYHLQLAIFPDYKIITYKYCFIDIFNKNYLKTLLNISPANFGGIGVGLFFIISGFVIHYGFIKKEHEFPQINLKEYFLKRFFRIYPPYLAVLLLFILFNIYKETYTLGNIVSHIFTFHNYKKEFLMSINPSFWSLAFEVQFYLLYPLFLIVRTRIGTLKILWVLFLIQVLIQILSNLYVEFFKKEIVFLISVLSFYYIWVAGAYLAERFFLGKRIFNLEKYQIFLLCILAYLYSFTKLNSYNIGGPILFCCLIVLDLYLWEENSVSNTNELGLLNKGLLNLGLFSYSFYLIHQPILDFLIPLFKIYNQSILFLSSCGILIFTLIYFLSKYSYKYIELRSIKLNSNLQVKKDKC